MQSEMGFKNVRCVYQAEKHSLKLEAHFTQALRCRHECLVSTLQPYSLV